MSNEGAGWVEPESFTLGVGGLDELVGSYEDTREASTFEVCNVVHTARRARASIGQRLDDSIAALGDLVTQIDRSWL